MHEADIIEWNKKRKLQGDQLDLLRPKHKCWVGNSSSEHVLTFDENPGLESMQIYVLKGRTDAEISESESVKDSHSFSEDSVTLISVDEEGRLVTDSAKTYQNERPSTSIDESAVDKECLGEADTFDYNESNPSHHNADLQALKNLEEQILEIESCRGLVYQEYAKDNTDESNDMEFEDLFSIRENRSMYVLSSGRWDVHQGILHS